MSWQSSLELRDSEAKLHGSMEPLSGAKAVLYVVMAVNVPHPWYYLLSGDYGWCPQIITVTSYL